jgi:hypothetical protein
LTPRRTHVSIYSQRVRERAHNGTFAAVYPTFELYPNSESPRMSSPPIGLMQPSQFVHLRFVAHTPMVVKLSSNDVSRSLSRCSVNFMLSAKGALRSLSFVSHVRLVPMASALCGLCVSNVVPLT